jgi:hypothetical protein
MEQARAVLRLFLCCAGLQETTMLRFSSIFSRASRASLYVGLSACLMVLTGCAMGGFSSSANPIETTAVSPGALQGSNYGGHAPIVGAEVFLLQASTSGYGGKATSLLQAQPSNPTALQAQYPTVADTTLVGTNSAPAYYVKTDAAGLFNITGDYTCTAGLPVYVYAIGGAPDTAGAALVASNLATGSASGTSLTFTVDKELFYPGQKVTFGGIPVGNAFASLNGNSYAVTSAPSSTQFTVTVPAFTATVATTTVSGTATPIGVNNPSIVNMAMLGNCPSSAPYTFSAGSSNPIQFIWMNEVSTAAMAFAMAPFAETSAGVGTDAQHIGIPNDALALTGLQNAATNAGQLYDITGTTGNNASSSDGEAHVARKQVPGSNCCSLGNSVGIVPQALLDTLGNILAACVDSASTAGTGAPGGSYSAQCKVLFENATQNGMSTGTNPTDTATAALNIAHFPAGVGNASFVSNLFNLPGPTVPFVPNLAAAPNDFSVGITIEMPGYLSNAALSPTATAATPQGIAIDAKGNALVTTNGCSGGCLLQVTPQQLLTNNTAASVSGVSSGISIDPFGQIWMTNFASTLGSSGPSYYVATEPVSTGNVTGYRDSFGAYQQPLAIATDSTGTAYIAESNLFAPYIHKLTGKGAATNILGLAPTAFTGIGCEQSANGLAVADSQYGSHLWTSAIPLQQFANILVAVCEIDWANGPLLPDSFYFLNYFYPTGLPLLSGIADPGGIATDINGNVWMSVNNPGETTYGAALFQRNAGNLPLNGLLFGNFGYIAGGGLNLPVGVAVDGNNHVWFANSGGNSVSEFTGGVPSSGLLPLLDPAGGFVNTPTTPMPTPVSPSTGFQSGLLSSPKQLAIDPSGDVWVVNTGNQTLTELIGIAAPTYTPLSAASGANALGGRP